MAAKPTLQPFKPRPWRESGSGILKLADYRIQVARKERTYGYDFLVGVAQLFKQSHAIAMISSRGKRCLHLILLLSASLSDEKPEEREQRSEGDRVAYKFYKPR